MKSKKLPHSAKEIFKLSLKDWLIYNTTALFYKLTGQWKYPADCSGDLETMTIFDKIYWRYKANNPIKKACKNSGLESFFADQKNTSFSLPARFKIQSQLTLSAVGDLMPHEYLTNSGNILYSEIHESIFGKDIAMANLECVISACQSGQIAFSKKTSPVLCYDTDTFHIVKGFRNRQYDFMATACNHSLDLGLPGIQNTIETLKKEGIPYHGINITIADTFIATIIEKNDIKIGLICYTFGTNAVKPPPDNPTLVSKLNLNDDTERIDFSQLQQQIDFCRYNKVDFIIAQLHWGYEYEFYPRPAQVKTAHCIAEMGIDCIIGHHPHVVQPLEFYLSKRDHQRIVPIYYSLGNLVNPFSAQYLTLSHIAEITLIKGTSNDVGMKTYVHHAGFSKVRQHADVKNKTIFLKKSR